MRIYYPTFEPAGVQPNGKPWPVLRLEQLTAIYRIVHEITDPDRSGSVLVGAGMGSGKTVVTVEAMLKTKPERALVTGVRDAYSQWVKALKEQQEAAPYTAFKVKREFLRINADATGMANLAKMLMGDPGWYYVGLEFLRSQDWEKVEVPYKIDAATVAMYGGPTEGVDDEGVQEQIIQLHTYKKMKKLDLLVSDEAHKHSNQKTASIDTINDIPTRAKIALSGTFFGNKFENAWSLCTWLWGKSVIGPKYTFLETYCVVKPIMSKDGKKQLTTKHGFPLTKVAGERHPGEYVETLPCYVFIPTPLGDVPPPELVKVRLTKEQLRQYEELEEQSLTWIPSFGKPGYEPLVADIPLVQRIRLRTAALGGMTLVHGKDEDSPDSITFEPGCHTSTLTAAYDVLHRPTWVGKKALILTHSLPFAIETARRIGMKYTVALKTGGTPTTGPNSWDVQKERFMLPPSDPNSIQYLVAVISAVGTAMDGLQENCAKVLWLSEDENNVNNIQGGNRIWREGVDLPNYESVQIVQEGTIAEGVLRKNVAHKADVLDSVAGAR